MKEAERLSFGFGAGAGGGSVRLSEWRWL